MPVIILIAAVLGAGALGYGSSVVINKRQSQTGKDEAAKILESAKVKSKEQILEAKEQACKNTVRNQRRRKAPP